MVKKVPIHLNEHDERVIKQLSDLLNLTGTYGEIPKTLKYSITLAEKYLEVLEKYIPDLKPEELDLIFQSIKKKKLAKYKEALKEKIDENPDLV